MKLHYFQHVPFEGLGQLQGWAESRGHSISSTRFFHSEAPPAPDSVDMLIVMGGPMGATDDARFSWMKREKAFIGEMIKHQKKVLGICLGAQMIADVSGARVYPNREKEIGWFPIELNPPNVRHSPLQMLPQRTTVFHWHSDTFDLPVGALHLARSQACDNQAFSIGPHVLGLQFHIEMGLSQIELILNGCAEELTSGRFVQNPQEMADQTRRLSGGLESILYRVMDSFVADRIPPGGHS